jgi:hypothetical protein
MRVASALTALDIACEDLSRESVQLGLILYPADAFNERLLLRMRQCGSSLPETHPVRRWLDWLAQARPLSEREQGIMGFLSEVLNSRYNLITDLEVKNRIIDILVEVPEHTVAERLLKSYLYLMIGNITRSDNLLREFVRRPPWQNWVGFSSRTSFFHRLASENLDQILAKLAGHPSDRGSYALFNRYLREIANDAPVIGRLEEHRSDALTGKLRLAATRHLAHDYVRLIELRESPEQRQLALLKDATPEFRTHWAWYFIAPPAAAAPMVAEDFARAQKADLLWFLYLSDGEAGPRSDLDARPESHLPFLRQQLKEPGRFMLALSKLIEAGAIDAALVEETLAFMAHD